MSWQKYAGAIAKCQLGGLKDRHAVTEQWLSVHLPTGGIPNFAAFLAQYPSIEILAVTRHNKKLRRAICSAMSLW